MTYCTIPVCAIWHFSVPNDVIFGLPDRLHHAMNIQLPNMNCDIVTCTTRAIGTMELSPNGLWPCQPLSVCCLPAAANRRLFPLWCPLFHCEVILLTTTIPISLFQGSITQPVSILRPAAVTVARFALRLHYWTVGYALGRWDFLKAFSRSPIG